MKLLAPSTAGNLTEDADKSENKQLASSGDSPIVTENNREAPASLAAGDPTDDADISGKEEPASSGENQTEAESSSQDEEQLLYECVSRYGAGPYIYHMKKSGNPQRALEELYAGSRFGETHTDSSRLLLQLLSISLAETAVLDEDEFGDIFRRLYPRGANETSRYWQALTSAQRDDHRHYEIEDLLQGLYQRSGAPLLFQEPREADPLLITVNCIHTGL